MCLPGCSSPKAVVPGFSGPITCTVGCANNPPYNPALWNSSPVKTSTNCYAYAANDASGHPAGTKPQPGIKCGAPAKSTSCAEVGRASVCDGMTPAPNPPPPKAGFYAVALVMDPGVDYHWYRLDNNGRWSHKPGHGDATDKDASGKPITNPEMADRNYAGTGVDYKDFCGYYYVPTGGLKTAP